MDDKLSKVKSIVNDSIDTALIGVNTLRCNPKTMTMTMTMTKHSIM